MFHITVLCEERAKRGMARLSAACFGVHFFAGNSIVNSPLHCWVLNGECERLCKSLCARCNTLFTVARRACAVIGSHLVQFVENVLLLWRELRGRSAKPGPPRKVVGVLRASSVENTT
jgi:hypothetical protein